MKSSSPIDECDLSSEQTKIPFLLRISHAQCFWRKDENGKNLPPWCLPNVRLFTWRVFFANSPLKPCNKSTRVNSSRNPNKSLNLPVLKDFVKFTWMHFSRLWYSHENSGYRWMLKKMGYIDQKSSSEPLWWTRRCNCSLEHALVKAFKCKYM